MLYYYCKSAGYDPKKDFNSIHTTVITYSKFLSCHLAMITNLRLIEIYSDRVTCLLTDRNVL